MKKASNKIKLNGDEKQLLGFYEKGEWKSVKDFEKQKRIAKTAAKNTLIILRIRSISNNG